MKSSLWAQFQAKTITQLKMKFCQVTFNEFFFCNIRGDNNDNIEKLENSTTIIIKNWWFEGHYPSINKMDFKD